MDIAAISIAIGTLVFVLVLVFENRKPKYVGLPPGPIRLPLIGTLYSNVLSISGLASVRKRFGDISTHYAGPLRFVMLSSYEAIKETAVNNASVCSDRGIYNSYTISSMNPKLKGIINCDFDQQFQQNRSASLAIFRDLGVGRSMLEERILVEVQYLTESIGNNLGKPFNPAGAFGCAAANVIMSVLFNRRGQYDDANFLEIIKSADEIIHGGKIMVFIDSLNCLQYLPPFKSRYATLKSTNSKLIDYLTKQIDAHMDEFEPGCTLDFVDHWMNRNLVEDNTKPQFDKEELVYTLRDILIAGTETVNISLRWSLLQLANRPDVHAKLCEEIDLFVGQYRPICWSDRDQMPYLESFILEIQRYHTPVPHGAPHYTKVNTKIGPYNIPPHTLLILNLHGIHMDENVFTDPQQFRPDRFIDSCGKFVKHPQVIPFAIGKRSCLGELLARQELFLFTAALVQRFEFRLPPGVAKIPESGTIGLNYIPSPFKIIAVPRCEKVETSF